MLYCQSVEGTVDDGHPVLFRVDAVLDRSPHRYRMFALRTRYTLEAYTSIAVIVYFWNESVIHTALELELPMILQTLIVHNQAPAGEDRHLTIFCHLTSYRIPKLPTTQHTLVLRTKVYVGRDSKLGKRLTCNASYGLCFTLHRLLLLLRF